MKEGGLRRESNGVERAGAENGYKTVMKMKTPVKMQTGRSEKGIGKVLTNVKRYEDAEMGEISLKHRILEGSLGSEDESHSDAEFATYTPSPHKQSFLGKQASIYQME